MREQVQGAAEHLVVVDGELAEQFRLVEERLLGPLAEAGAAGGDPSGVLPGVPSGPAGALSALGRVRHALAEAADGGPRVWAPNGRWEHAGLRLAYPEARDLDLLYAALRALSGALAGPIGSEPGLASLLHTLAADAGSTAAGLVGALARALAAVDLAPDADTAVLARALRTAGGEDVRLTADQEVAWQRLAHRVTMLLTEAVPLHRFLG